MAFSLSFNSNLCSVKACQREWNQFLHIGIINNRSHIVSLILTTSSSKKGLLGRFFLSMLMYWKTVLMMASTCLSPWSVSCTVTSIRLNLTKKRFFCMATTLKTARATNRTCQRRGSSAWEQNNNKNNNKTITTITTWP